LSRQPLCWRSDRRWCGRPRDENRPRRRDQSPRVEQKVSDRSGRRSRHPIDPPNVRERGRSRVDPAQGWPHRAGPPARGLHVPRQGTLKVSSRSGRSVSTNQMDPPARGDDPCQETNPAVTPHGCGIFENRPRKKGAPRRRRR
jgi:hypothetical protein